MLLHLVPSICSQQYVFRPKAKGAVVWHDSVLQAVATRCILYILFLDLLCWFEKAADTAAEHYMLHTSC